MWVKSISGDNTARSRHAHTEMVIALDREPARARDLLTRPYLLRHFVAAEPGGIETSFTATRTVRVLERGIPLSGKLPGWRVAPPRAFGARSTPCLHDDADDRVLTATSRSTLVIWYMGSNPIRDFGLGG